MNPSIQRRRFLQIFGSSAVVVPFLNSTSAKGAPIVSIPKSTEPLVRLLEETPQAEVVEAFAERIRDGAAYRDVLAALLMAGVRNVEPRPTVGYQFHTVLVVQAIHLISSALEGNQRWIPLLWATDYFKDAQAEDERQRNWTMPPVDESAVAALKDPTTEFVDAMEAWDEPKADAAAVALARTAKPGEIWELFFGFGPRDFRSIGHKAIDVCNTHRILGVIGWEYAEPALRSLAYALLMHEGENPAARDAWADRPGRENWSRIERFPARWNTADGNGAKKQETTVELMAALRDGSEDEGPEKVVELLKNGAAVQAIWDGLFLSAGELLVRQPGIVALHSLTTSRAIHYAYRFAKDDRTRAYALLQNAAFLPMFRRTMGDRGEVAEFRLDDIEPDKSKPDDDGAVVEAVFDTIGKDTPAAARKTLGYFAAGGASAEWIDTARNLLLRKGSGPHDYKFASALFELHDHISPEWRGHLMGAGTFILDGTSAPDNPLVNRIETALGG